jgi:hypothetical protein
MIWGLGPEEDQRAGLIPPPGAVGESEACFIKHQKRPIETSASSEKLMTKDRVRSEHQDEEKQSL